MSAATEQSTKSDVAPKDVADDTDAYTTTNLGVWKLLLPNDMDSRGVFTATKQKWNAIVSAYPMVLGFFQEIYRLDPHLFVLLIALKLWGEIESVVMLYVSGRLLRIIEVGLIQGRPDIQAIVQALVARPICVTVSATAKWARTVSNYTSKIIYCEATKLRLDMPTADDSSSKSQATAGSAWSAFSGLCDAFMRLFGLISQLVFISQQKSGGTLFTLIALVRPIMTLVGERTLWLKPLVAYSDNAAYLRLRSLQSMSAARFRGDVIAGDIAGWITTGMLEYWQAGRIPAGENTRPTDQCTAS
ncbi:hypothetical protein DFH06DRAFT_1299473 [Mycena polygramma]|nr:hypothetical protein DFH06DRAFT_1299473 [Mycena polygramma]